MAKPTYDKDTDYQALINQAIQSGNASLARQYGSLKEMLK